MGIVSAIGVNLPENLHALQRGTTGIAPLQYLKTRHHQLPVGEVKQSTEKLFAFLNPREPRRWSRNALLALRAAREAMQGVPTDPGNASRTGLISATTVGGMDRTEDFYPGFMEDSDSGRLREVVNHDCGASTQLLADELGINDFFTTINTACSSSVNAIMLGVRLIQSGRLDRVLVGGTDGLSRFTLNGFKALMILDDQPCRPFDANRKGLNLGEGAAYLLLERESAVVDRKAKAEAVVCGFANANDAFHQTASSPEGRGAQKAMVEALQRAGLTPADIDCINAHGTATPNNDLAEGIAISEVFKNDTPLVSSTKGFTGHTLGAAGAIEAVYSVLGLQQQCAFANLRLENTMPEISFEPVRELTKAPIKHVMSNSFGFGGNCSSIIFGAV